jgi:DnaJ-class molecular chaperone
MDTTDYYNILGVDSQASGEAIKAAFKKLALQYHPDVYKGADAQERMRGLLRAYQTLSDPVARKEYDAQRGGKSVGESATTRKGNATSQNFGRDKRFAFPDLNTTPVTTLAFKLDKMSYQLSPAQAETLRWEGVLRGKASDPAITSSGMLHSCHRCSHQWFVPTSISAKARDSLTCSNCRAKDWAEYLLLRCTHCQAVFESREISDPLRGGNRYHPYELFPLCPHCRRSRWCSAENARVAGLRTAAARRSMLLWSLALVVGVLVIVLVALVFFRLS